MTTFWVIAGLLALCSAAWIVAPLWRAATSRLLVVAIGASVIIGATGLYLHWSQWHWPQASALDNTASMISRLARRLEREPNDVEGWLMLARSHAAIGQYPLARRAYQRALRLQDGRNAEALIGLGELLVMQEEGAVSERAARFFEQALVLQPDSERALFFAGVAAQGRGQVVLAIERFERLIALGPPANIQAILREQIATLRAGGDRPPRAVPASAEARIRVRVSVSDALAAGVPRGSTLFVFVRRVGAGGPPLAVKRLPATLPQTIELTAADSMLPGVSFVAGEEVEVSAKLSADGSATPRSGEPIGRIRYRVGSSAEQNLVVDGLSK